MSFPFNWTAPPIGAWLPSKVQSIILTVISLVSNPVFIAPPYNVVAVLLIKVQFTRVPSVCSCVAPPWLALLLIKVELLQVIPGDNIHNAPPCALL